MATSFRTFPSAIKSLLHFDYPYPGETGDGLRDEIGTYSWQKNGNVAFAGNDPSCAEVYSGIPKFGYRCLSTHSNSEYISASGTWDFESSGVYEVSFFFNPRASQNGNLFGLYMDGNQMLNISIDANLQLHVACDVLGIGMASSDARLLLDYWRHLKFTLSGSLASLFVDEDSVAYQEITRTSVPANQARIGGFAGFIDEFVFRTSKTYSTPLSPMRGTLSAETIGGFGTGKLGDISITKPTVMSSTALLTNFKDENTSANEITFEQHSPGSFGGFATGDELMFIERTTGFYDFVTVLSISGNSLFLNKLPHISLYHPYVYICQVPHFNTLTIAANATVRTGSFGYMAFRVKGDCTVSGNIISSGYGLSREDFKIISHPMLIDRFICDNGGGIFIACGGTFTAPSSARIGAAWDGTPAGGKVTAKNSGSGGGAGYGGGGGSRSSTTSGLGSVGVIGKGGDGFSPSLYYGTAGGKPGYPGTANSENQGGVSGASLILIAGTLQADRAAISTGGGGGFPGNASTGGGGTGYCYIACGKAAV